MASAQGALRPPASGVADDHEDEEGSPGVEDRADADAGGAPQHGAPSTRRLPEGQTARGGVAEGLQVLPPAHGGAKRGGGAGDTREQRVADLKDAPCRECGELRHWASDIPQKDQVVIEMANSD